MKNEIENNILLIKIPEFYMTYEPTNPERAMHGPATGLLYTK